MLNYLEVCVIHNETKECDRDWTGECEFATYISRDHHDEWMRALSDMHANSIERLLKLL